MSTLSKAAWRARIRAQRRASTSAAGTLPSLTFDAGTDTPAVGARDARVAGAGTDPGPAAGADLARVGLEWLASVSSSGAGMTVCGYVSTGLEPPTGPLLTAWVAAGHTVYVPVCEPDFQLSWARWHPGIEMAKSVLAPVMEPVGPRLPFAALGLVQAILLPALAVDTAGVRLGQGGGYYDRFLAIIPALPLAAVVYAHELVAPGLLPHDSLDVSVTYALTPAGYQRCVPLPR
ncbi:5-formyltetrahydrofolate cyclo-ligase [Arthrobacter sp. TMN-49]